ASQPPLERPPPALAGRLERQVDRVADHQAPPAHLAQDGERHVLAPGDVAEPPEMSAAEREQHARLALAEEERVGPHALLEIDPHAEPGSAGGARSRRPRPATTAWDAPPRRR